MKYDRSKNSLPEAVGVSLRRADYLTITFQQIYDSLDEEAYSKNELYGRMAPHIKTIGEAYFMGSYIEFFLTEILE